MEIISKHFSYAEVIKSQTATRRGLENTPGAYQLCNIRNLASMILEPLRLFLNAPVFISSWFRCPLLNRLLGSSDNSQHVIGEAVDIDCGSLNYKIFNFIKDSLIFDQLVWEFGDNNNPAWVHVSYSSKRNRGAILIAKRIKGETVYEYVSIK